MSKKILLIWIAAALFIFPLAYAGLPSPSAAAVSTQSKEAVRQGESLLKKLALFKEAISSGSLEKIESLYDGLAKQRYIAEKSIARVSGASNRSILLSSYIRPVEIEMERTGYEVSEYRLLASIIYQVSSEVNYKQYDTDMAKAERLKKRKEVMKSARNYEPLPGKINEELRYMEAYASGINLALNIYTLSIYVDTFPDMEPLTDLHQANLTYDKVIQYLRQTEGKIGQVPNKKYRKALLEGSVTPVKIMIERTKYEISQYRLMNRVSELIDAGKIEEAKTQFSKLEGLKTRAAAIKKAGGYEPLAKEIGDELLAYEADLKAVLDGK
ncbi:hypothetical protein J9317_04930 [Metabacillus sp. KIGAM252]|uniref:SbsC C-terminal domain-containing protein n=1 Tax=Metabacillus flavus TaxID=2823519 RepID=A0ABS5LBJ1_9BACI|nr:hypothetical protein [Metabacillus flavus]MBS2968098.1 hypothetical protein [Metabacillus flavus]